MLRACANLLRPGGRTAYLTIHAADGQSPSQRRRAHRWGPPGMATRGSQRQLLEAAGFADIVETDHSAEFAAVIRGWRDQWDQHRSEMEALWGVAGFQQRQRDRRYTLKAVEDGILRRSMLVATRA